MTNKRFYGVLQALVWLVKMIEKKHKGFLIFFFFFDRKGFLIY